MRRRVTDLSRRKKEEEAMFSFITMLFNKMALKHYMRISA